MRRSDRSFRLGIDLGGTKIEILALDRQGAERFRQRVPTPQGDYAAILRTISTLVDAAEQTLRAAGSVGIGTPGSISRATGLLRGSNSVCMNGKAITRDLAQLLGREVRITNDANCFALSEASDGAARGFDVVFGVILGTGVGGGIVVGGRVLDGPNAIAGEWGHNPLPWPRDDERPGALCFCGRPGCIETWVSGPGMARDHLKVTGERVAPADIVARAAAGDVDCEATLARHEERLARSLAHVINILDPRSLVLGGGLSNIERLYVNVPALWGAWACSDRTDPQLVRNKHRDSSGARGAP